jgi:hypothetical protein
MVVFFFVVTEKPVHLRTKTDGKTSLALIDLAA